MLGARLRSLERVGVIETSPNPAGRGSVYHLTEAGTNLVQLVKGLGIWGQQYLEIQPGSFDKPSLAANAVVRGVDPPRTDLIVARLYEFLDSVTSLLRDDKQVIREFLASGASMVRTLDVILKTNQGEIGRVLEHLDALSAEAAKLLATIRSGVGDAAQLREGQGGYLGGEMLQDVDRQDRVHRLIGDGQGQQVGRGEPGAAAPRAGDMVGQRGRRRDEVGAQDP